MMVSEPTHICVTRLQWVNVGSSFLFNVRWSWRLETTTVFSEKSKGRGERTNIMFQLALLLLLAGSCLAGPTAEREEIGKEVEKRDAERNEIGKDVGKRDADGSDSNQITDPLSKRSEYTKYFNRTYPYSLSDRNITFPECQNGQQECNYKKFNHWSFLIQGPPDNRHVSVILSLNIRKGLTPDSKVHGANMGPIWGRQDLGRPHDGLMNFATWDVYAALLWRVHLAT